MRGVKPKEPGDIITTGEFNTIAAATNEVIKAVGGGDIGVTKTPAGLTISTEKGSIQITGELTVVEGVNVGGERVAPFSAVQLVDSLWGGSVYSEEKVDQGIRVKTPEVTQFGRFGVTLDALEPNQSNAGGVCISGVVPCEVAAHHGYDDSRAEYADTVAGEPHLQLCEKGTAQVLWIKKAMRGAKGPAPALVRVGLRRDVEGVGIKRYGRSRGGTVEVLHVTENTVTEVAPGVVVIS